VNSDNLGALQLPRKTGHDIDGIGSTDTTSDHTETTGVRGVRIGTDHHQTWNGVVFEDDLVDNTRTGLPESDSVLDKAQRMAGQYTRVFGQSHSSSASSPWHKK
jgi:hypothetical protein